MYTLLIGELSAYKFQTHNNDDNGVSSKIKKIKRKETKRRLREQQRRAWRKKNIRKNSKNVWMNLIEIHWSTYYESTQISHQSKITAHLHENNQLTKKRNETPKYTKHQKPFCLSKCLIIKKGKTKLIRTKEPNQRSRSLIQCKHKYGTNYGKNFI